MESRVSRKYEIGAGVGLGVDLGALSYYAA
jgi:hypothetical protein